MTYVLVQNDRVLNGPRAWNWRSFNSTLTEELGITYTLPLTYTDTTPIQIAPGVIIYYAEYRHDPVNLKIQYEHGPFWDFSTGIAIGTFQILDADLTWVKGNLKNIVATNRYIYEQAGTQVTVQGQPVTVDTSREGRNIFIQKYLLMADGETAQWKFPEGWRTISKAELGSIVAQGAAYIQAQFTWEALKGAEIDACDTLAKVDAVVLEKTGA